MEIPRVNLHDLHLHIYTNLSGVPMSNADLDTVQNFILFKSQYAVLISSVIYNNKHAECRYI